MTEGLHGWWLLTSNVKSVYVVDDKSIFHFQSNYCVKMNSMQKFVIQKLISTQHYTERETNTLIGKHSLSLIVKHCQG